MNLLRWLISVQLLCFNKISFWTPCCVSVQTNMTRHHRWKTIIMILLMKGGKRMRHILEKNKVGFILTVFILLISACSNSDNKEENNDLSDEQETENIEDEAQDNNME